MKKNIINKIVLSTISLIMSFTFIACSDWTDTESIDIDSPQVEHQNPALYKKYLENLRKYKESDHKVIYTWLDNSSKTPTSQALLMNTLPDSIDYIVLNQAENLANWEIQEMQKVRKKSTKVLAIVDFDAIKLEYDLEMQEKTDEEASSNEPSFIGVLTDKVNNTLTAVKTYNFDGLMISYKGKSIIHMTEEEKEEYLANENTFMSLVLEWRKNNPEKLFTFMGNPQNVVYDLSFDSFKHIIVPTTDALNGSGLTYKVTLALTEGIPTDRIIVTADMTSLDQADIKTGYWSDGSKAIISTSQWALSTHESFNSVGVGFYNIGNDYYNPEFTFPTIREAISILNPSFK